MGGKDIPVRRSCCGVNRCALASICTAVDSRGRNHRGDHKDEVIEDLGQLKVTVGYRRCQAPNLRLIRLCARKIVKRTLSESACQWRRNCSPHVGLKKEATPLVETNGQEKMNKVTHVQSGVSLAIDVYCSCLGSREMGSTTV